jgi:hypothetical protein
MSGLPRSVAATASNSGPAADGGVATPAPNKIRSRIWTSDEVTTTRPRSGQPSLSSKPFQISGSLGHLSSTSATRSMSLSVSGQPSSSSKPSRSSAPPGHVSATSAIPSASKSPLAAALSAVTGASAPGCTSVPLASGRGTKCGVRKSVANESGAPVASVRRTPSHDSSETLSTIAHACKSTSPPGASGSATRYVVFHAAVGTAYDTVRLRPGFDSTTSTTTLPLSLSCGVGNTAATCCASPVSSITVSVLITSSTSCGRSTSRR